MATSRTGTAAWKRQRKAILADMRSGAISDICAECGQRMDPDIPGTAPNGVQIDHIIARAAGGSDDRSNLRPLHSACNKRRDDRSTDAYRQRRARADQLYFEAYGRPVGNRAPAKRVDISSVPARRPDGRGNISVLGAWSEWAG